MKSFIYKGGNAKLWKAVEEQFPQLSYSSYRKLLRKKDIKINGARVGGETTVKEDDLIEVYAADEILSPKKTAFEIKFEDERLLIAIKPAGIEVENEEGFDFTDSVNLYLKEFEAKASPCHRLDRNTAGLIVYAKTKEAYEEVLEAFRIRAIEKYYLAAVKGCPKRLEATLDAYLFKDSEKSHCYISDDKKQGYVPIQTRYRVLQKFEKYSVLEVELITGKTHQIRAHMAHIGCPVIGDNKYGDAELNKLFKKKAQCLIAYKLVLRFPEKAALSYLNNEVIEIKNSKFF